MELIKETQEAWKAAKKAAEKRCEQAHDYDMARKLAACRMFSGEENLEEMINLMFTPRGAEFLTRYGFPSLDIFRKYKPFNPEQYGVYIDCGEINLSEVRRAFLVGKTSARITFRDVARNQVILMHGASAQIIVGGHSVVHVENDGSGNLSFIKRENGIVI